MSKDLKGIEKWSTVIRFLAVAVIVANTIALVFNVMDGQWSDVFWLLSVNVWAWIAYQAYGNVTRLVRLFQK